MNLLLLLTALFASLTGGGSGDRALRQVQGVAVARAAEAVQVAVDPAQRALPSVIREGRATQQRKLLPQTRTAPLAATHLPFERRLE
ncbi:hypothetical protein ACMGDH_09570 [Sphingomonas sp. DT-207]|uniref:hypothetical protein n=1 Tax=Sphingomonas sp. DT-207 TaxID=3396167 RepID=UPI003F1B0F9D